MKLTVLLCSVLLATGCASAEQRIASKAHYRQSQVDAIRVQEDGRVNRAQVAALEQQAMWNALAEVVKANPEAASNVAIVAAVAASRGGSGGQAPEAAMIALRGEQDAALQWAQVLAGPVLSTVGTLGVAALNNDMQKAIVRETTKAQIVESEQDGKIYDMIGKIAENRSTGGDSYVISDNGIYNAGGSLATETDNSIVEANTSEAPVTDLNQDSVIVSEEEALDPELDPIVDPSTPTTDYQYNGPVPTRDMNAAWPDYDAGANTDTIGGISNTGHFGVDVIWDRPDYLDTLGEGDILSTQVGDYQVVDTREGTVGLLPIGDAHSSNSDVLWNFTTGDHHVGINPFTGEVWTQEASYNPGDFEYSIITLME